MNERPVPSDGTVERLQELYEQLSVIAHDADEIPSLFQAITAAAVATTGEMNMPRVRPVFDALAELVVAVATEPRCEEDRVF